MDGRYVNWQKKEETKEKKKTNEKRKIIKRIKKKETKNIFLHHDPTKKNFFSLNQLVIAFVLID